MILIFPILNFVHIVQLLCTGKKANPDRTQKTKISYILLEDFIVRFLEIGIACHYHPFWPSFSKDGLVIIRHACCRFGTQLRHVATATKIAILSLFWLETNVAVLSKRDPFLMLTTNVAKSHGKRSLFSTIFS